MDGNVRTKNDSLPVRGLRALIAALYPAKCLTCGLLFNKKHKPAGFETHQQVLERSTFVADKHGTFEKLMASLVCPTCVSEFVPMTSPICPTCGVMFKSKEGEDHIEIIDEIMGSLTEDFQRKEEFEPAIFPDIIKGVCNHIGSLSKLTQFGMKKYKIIKTIEAMKAWHIVIEVEQQKLEPSKSVLLPKRYLHDVGVVNRFRTITAPSISIINTLDQALRTSLGGLFENAVLLNLLKGSSIYTKIYGWKKGNNTDVEVEFILDLEKKNKMKVPVECKAALKV